MSCLMFTLAYAEDQPVMHIVSDGKTITCIRDGKTISVRPVSEKVHIEPGQKSSRTNPIVIDSRKVDTYDDLENIQREHLEKLYPRAEWVGPNTTKEQEQFLQQVTFRTKDGKVGSIFFDVTKCFKKLKKKNKELKEQIESFEAAAIRMERLIKNGGKPEKDSN